MKRSGHGASNRKGQKGVISVKTKWSFSTRTEGNSGKYPDQRKRRERSSGTDRDLICEECRTGAHEKMRTHWFKKRQRKKQWAILKLNDRKSPKLDSHLFKEMELKK
jgi:hypothetical protein